MWWISGNFLTKMCYGVLTNIKCSTRTSYYALFNNIVILCHPLLCRKQINAISISVREVIHDWYDNRWPGVRWSPVNNKHGIGLVIPEGFGLRSFGMYNGQSVLGCDPFMIWTHWGRDKIDAILQTTFSNATSWTKIFECRLKFPWSLFLKVQLTIFQHWFR